METYEFVPALSVVLATPDNFDTIRKTIAATQSQHAPVDPRQAEPECRLAYH
jgi:hypothetical protein